MRTKTIKAYHFLKDDMCGGYGDEPAWKVGEEREVKGKLQMCQKGYHASPSFYDALSYAKGNMACVVELSGEIIKDTDKYVARKRKLIGAKDAEKVLRAWGCDCAERALRKARVKDERSWNAIRVARLYNEGKATGDELAAAGAAAWAAARDAAWAAAWAAARAAAWDAARAAARAAAWAAARDAARAAARDASGNALLSHPAYKTMRVISNTQAVSVADAQIQKLEQAAGAAARAAGAARAAEIKWQKRHLNKLMKELLSNGITSTYKEV